MNRSSLINRIQRKCQQLQVYRFSDSGEYGFSVRLIKISLNYHPMESTSVITASTTPIPSNPQVPILPFPHHSMLLLSNQPSDANASTSNPHPLFPLSLTNRLDAHEPLNTRSIAIAFLPSPSPFLTYSHSFPVTPQVTGVFGIQ